MDTYSSLTLVVSLQTGKINDIHRQWKYVGGGVKIRELTFTGSVVISPTLLLWLAINLYFLCLCITILYTTKVGCGVGSRSK